MVKTKKLVVTISTRNIPLLEINNFCMLNNLDYDLDNEEIIIYEVVKNEM